MFSAVILFLCSLLLVEGQLPSIHPSIHPSISVDDSYVHAYTEQRMHAAYIHTYIHACILPTHIRTYIQIHSHMQTLNSILTYRYLANVLSLLTYRKIGIRLRNRCGGVHKARCGAAQQAPRSESSFGASVQRDRRAATVGRDRRQESGQACEICTVLFTTFIAHAHRSLLCAKTQVILCPEMMSWF
jgi:hypothetical protein